jgi:hypothetical protein
MSDRIGNSPEEWQLNKLDSWWKRVLPSNPLQGADWSAKPARTVWELIKSANA